MKKVKFSWERGHLDEVHSPEGINDLKQTVKYALIKQYTGINESQWEWKGLDDDKFKDMVLMSRGTMPEKLLNNNGTACVFEYGNQIHILPWVDNGVGINQYGFPVAWHPMPTGWSELNKPNSDLYEQYSKMVLTEENSVIIRNDLFGTNDADMIEKMVSLLVDNILTANQLQLLASMPFVFNVTEDNVLTAKNFFLSICEHKPAIFTNAYGEKAVPVVENFDTKIDPSLFEIFDRFECVLLSYLGFPCVPITKRAQQSVSEVQSNDDKVMVRRKEKLRMRELACDRINGIFGTNVSVTNVVDDKREDMENDMMREQEAMKDGYNGE